ncbi:MAG: hypothetical protein ACFHWX_10695 [Bacteroidota bacterium]
MIELLNLGLGISLIVTGVYLPFSVYNSFKEKIRYRVKMVSIAIEFGLIAISIGFNLLAFY